MSTDNFAGLKRASRSAYRRHRERIAREMLFPSGCVCLSYGRGLTMTRVNSPDCPVHADQRETE